VFGVLGSKSSKGGIMGFIRFEDLHVFQLAEKFSDEVWDMVQPWKFFEKQTVGIQLVKAADSIGANIAEGAGRGTPKDNQRFIRIARGSLNESKFWLRRTYKRNLFKHNEIESLKALMGELGPMLNAYLKSIGRANTKHQTLNTKH
jgi:four helix bundle protein